MNTHAASDSRTPTERYLVCFVSDSTAITAEKVGISLLSQFPELVYDQRHIPFVNTPHRAENLLQELRQAQQQYGNNILLFATMPDQQINALLMQAPGHYYELFNRFVSRLSRDLQLTTTTESGTHHGLTNVEDYDSRMDVVNYALSHDDAMSFQHLGLADVILVGVSRSGKTPTCLYLALHFGLRAANYPLTEDDFERADLPEILKKHRNKLIGLTLSVQRLSMLREKRRPGSHYASLTTCQSEINQSLQLFRRYQLTVLDTTSRSIEELAAKIVHIHTHS